MIGEIHWTFEVENLYKDSHILEKKSYNSLGTYLRHIYNNSKETTKALILLKQQEVMRRNPAFPTSILLTPSCQKSARYNFQKRKRLSAYITLIGVHTTKR